MDGMRGEPTAGDSRFIPVSIIPVSIIAGSFVSFPVIFSDPGEDVDHVLRYFGPRFTVGFKMAFELLF